MFRRSPMKMASYPCVSLRRLPVKTEHRNDDPVAFSPVLVSRVREQSWEVVIWGGELLLVDDQHRAGSYDKSEESHRSTSSIERRFRPA
jgi:hypothetical protein